MENKVKTPFDCAYESPEVQVTEVFVEQGFQASLASAYNAGVLDYSETDFDEFE